MSYGKLLKKKHLYKSLIGLIVLAFIFVNNIVAQPERFEGKVTFLADDKLLKPMIQDIENAKKNIFIAIYMFKTDDYKFNLSNLIEEALYDALDRGVRVYVVFDKGRKDDITTEFNMDTAEELKRRGAVVRFDSPKRRLHSKLMVIDEKIVYIGSHNYTHSALKYNNETSVRIESADVANEAIKYIKGIQ